MAQTKLQDTTLAMIVRDEIMNPAGGVELMLRCHLPFVEEAVVVDTGSVDGTRQALEQLQSEYPQLAVYDKEWKGFADARNASIAHVKTPRALILDADELLEPEEIEKLKTTIKKCPRLAYDLHFESIFPNGISTDYCSCLNPRTFLMNSNKGALFGTNEHYDWAEIYLNFFKDAWCDKPAANVLHFLSGSRSWNHKKQEWYKSGAWRNQQPAENARENGWKRFNIQRLRYYFPPEIKDKAAYLKERGALEVPSEEATARRR